MCELDSDINGLPSTSVGALLPVRSVPCPVGALSVRALSLIAIVLMLLGIGIYDSILLTEWAGLDKIS